MKRLCGYFIWSNNKHSSLVTDHFHKVPAKGWPSPTNFLKSIVDWNGVRYVVLWVGNQSLIKLYWWCLSSINMYLISPFVDVIDLINIAHETGLIGAVKVRSKLSHLRPKAPLPNTVLQESSTDSICQGEVSKWLKRKRQTERSNGCYIQSQPDIEALNSLCDSLVCLFVASVLQGALLGWQGVRMSSIMHA